MSQTRFLWIAYSGLGVAMAVLILLNPNHFKSIDSAYYLQSATNLLAGRGYVVHENGQLVWNGTFPFGYSALISVVSDLTGLPALIASKLVNYLAIGVSGYLWTRRLGVPQALWLLSIWALGGFLKIAVYTWSETVFLVLLAEWVWYLHLFLRNPVASRAFILFLIGYALFLIRYIGGFVFGLTGILTILVSLLPDRIRTQLGITQTRSITLNLLISLAAGVLSMSAYFWMNRQLSGSFFGGERFVSTESALELTKIFGWAMLNECLLIRDFVPADSNKLAWIGLCIQLLLFSIVYGQQHRHRLPDGKGPAITLLIWLFLFTAGIYLLVLFSFRTSSPFSNPNLRLMAPFTFCFLWAGGLWIGTWTTHWQKKLFPYWLLLLLCSWLQLLPQTDLSQKISLLWY
ncbi:hypothetical protein GO755_35770 [Spirosoma sp. HMF4905]|uniref:Glycosyltransferase RgtA/B/C/D-like domain-containing protein n=1 Tax=Spirosoma arboris TaxID=2682092 RepID=A0A7K1SNQ5_9BACT|nr:hypothetical protein [Spirosoma arboris]MVM35435.1 hypothetical protein [Spirosoma arboris]